MDHARYIEVTDDLRDLIAERLSIRAKSFPRAVRKAGRLLPPNARAAADALIQLEPRVSHPKLAVRTDPAQVDHAAETIRTALSAHRPGARASRQRSLFMAEVGFRALVLIGAGLAFLQWHSPV
ncbi:hypothetical protein [Hasllibacter sp. MH4015]|uniref:hypothetical protein n=1 Tax=Hasllibacter sp. MH4015 TaxID=2854029 RepID=UPI001CD66322|nr:hypothetical protein [Hasllibacter sp. MH4015]